MTALAETSTVTVTEAFTAVRQLLAQETISVSRTWPEFDEKQGATRALRQVLHLLEHGALPTAEQLPAPTCRCGTCRLDPAFPTSHQGMA